MENDEQESNVTPSMLGDIIKAYGGDKEKAKFAIKEMNDPHIKQIKQALQLFPNLTEKIVRQILSKNNWLVAASLDDLERENSNIIKKRNLERLKKEKEEIERRRQEDLKSLMNNFVGIEKETIEKVFDEFKNDMKKVVTKLIEITNENKVKEEEKLEQKKQQRRAKIRVQLCEKFEHLSKKEIDNVLKKNEYNLKKTVVELSNISHCRLCTNLHKALGGKISEREVFKILQKHKWNMSDAFKFCKELIENREKELEQEKQKKKQQEEEKEQNQKKQEEEKEKEISDEQVIEEETFQSQIIVNDIQNTLVDEEAKSDKEIEQQVTNTIINVLEPNLNTNNNDNKEGENKNGDDDVLIDIKRENEKAQAKIRYEKATRYSWVGLFKSEEENNKNYIVYSHLCYLKDNLFEFDVPKVNGKYEIRVFSSGYNLVGKSKAIEVKVEDSLDFSLNLDENKVTVDFTIGSFDPIAKRAYITVHFSNEDRYNYYRRYDWVRSFNGQIKFKKLVHAGEYEARLYVGSKLKLKSNKLNIPGI